jgi:hypothetical protein
VDPPDKPPEALKDIGAEARCTHKRVDGAGDGVLGAKGALDRLAAEIRGLRAEMGRPFAETSDLLDRSERPQAESETRLSELMAELVDVIREVRDEVLEARAAEAASVSGSKASSRAT